LSFLETRNFALCSSITTRTNIVVNIFPAMMLVILLANDVEINAGPVCSF
jgi:hypothetical protein